MTTLAHFSRLPVIGDYQLPPSFFHCWRQKYITISDFSLLPEIVRYHHPSLTVARDKLVIIRFIFFPEVSGSHRPYLLPDTLSYHLSLLPEIAGHRNEIFNYPD